MKKIILKLVLLLTIISASIKAEDLLRPNLPTAQEHVLTSTQGVLDPKEIINLKPKDFVKFYLSDGTEISGMLNKAEFKTKEHFECFGESFSHENTGFGFILNRNGTFAGALVMRNSDTTYTVEYSDKFKGYILLKKQKSKIII